MESKFYDKDKLLILKITDEIDDHNVQNIRRKADYEIERYMPKKIIFDLDSVTFMDSAGIGMLIGRYKIVKTFGGSLEMINVKPSIRKVFEMSGVLKIVPIRKDINLNVS